MNNINASFKNRHELGILLKELRKKNKYSIDKLSKITNINVADIYKIENGEKLRINPFHLKILANTFKYDYKIFYKKIGFLEQDDYFLKKEEIMKIINMTPTEKEKLKEKLVISEDEENIVHNVDIHTIPLKEDE